MKQDEMKQDEILDVEPERKAKFDAMRSAEDARRAADAADAERYCAYQAYQRRYYQTHKAEISTRKAEWSARNSEKCAAYAKAWRARNPEKNMQIRIRAAIRFLEKHGYTVTK